MYSAGPGDGRCGVVRHVFTHARACGRGGGISMLRSLFKTSSYATGKRLQEHADTVRLWLLTGAYEAWPKPAKVTAEDLDELPSIAELRAIVSDRVQMQALTMLSAWHHERPPPQPPESSNSPVSYTHLTLPTILLV